mgnify:CR=1 FL=1
MVGPGPVAVEGAGHGEEPPVHDRQGEAVGALLVRALDLGPKDGLGLRQPALQHEQFAPLRFDVVLEALAARHHRELGGNPPRRFHEAAAIGLRCPIASLEANIQQVEEFLDPEIALRKPRPGHHLRVRKLFGHGQGLAVGGLGGVEVALAQENEPLRVD